MPDDYPGATPPPLSPPIPPPPSSIPPPPPRPPSPPPYPWRRMQPSQVTMVRRVSVGAGVALMAAPLLPLAGLAGIVSVSLMNLEPFWAWVSIVVGGLILDKNQKPTRVSAPPPAGTTDALLAMMLDHAVGVHDQVSWDAADLCRRWSARTPTALAMPSSTRPSSTGSARPPSPGGVLVRASSGRLELRVPNGVSDRSACEGSRRLWREPRALCVRDSPHLDRWFRATPRATTTTMPSAPTPTAGVGFGSPDPAHPRRKGNHQLAGLLKQ